MEHIKRTFLWSVIFSLVAAAGVGVLVLALGDFGNLEDEALLTTLVLSYFSITALGCTKATLKAVAIPGLVLSAVGLVVSLVLVWWDFEADLWEVAGSTAIAAFACVHIGLLSAAKLRPPAHWLFWGTSGAIVVLALVLIGMVLAGDASEEMLRFSGALAIVVCCASLIVPIVARSHRVLAERLPTDVFTRIEVGCPRCRSRSTRAVGFSRCGQCGLGLRLDLVPDEGSP